MNGTFKRCGCGRSYSRQEWNELPLCGYQEGARGRASPLFELRQCGCESSLAVDLADLASTISERRILVARVSARI